MTISKQFLLAALFAGGAALSAAAQTQFADNQPPAQPPAQPAEFPRDVRAALRSLISEEVVPALKESRIPTGQGVVIPSPLYGDRDNFVRNLLKNAVTDSGRDCVESQDDIWPAIMKELGFNEGFKDLMNDALMTRLGEHWPSRIMLYGWIRAERDRKGPNPGSLFVECSLHAAELVTRRHIWGKDFTKTVTMTNQIPIPPPSPKLLPADTTTADLAVFATARPQDDDSSDLALELLSITRETIGGQGFQVALDAAKADVALQLSVRKSVFDRTGNYAVMEGSVRAIALVPARKGFYLGETRIDRERGERKLGDRDAMLSVRDGIEPKLVSWIGQNITAEKAGLAAIMIPCDISMLDDNSAAKFISGLCADAVKIDGIARCALAEQTPDRATFYISYIVEKLPEGPVNALRARYPQYFPVERPDL